MERLNYIARADGRFAVTGAPGGFDAFLVAEAAARADRAVLFVLGDDVHAQSAIEAVRFFAPQTDVLSFPAWDCLPYDRVSPKPDIESTRLATLAVLARRGKDAGPCVVVTTVNALLQRVPPRESIAEASFSAHVGNAIDHDKLTAFLARNGYVRAGTVREPGDFALRGGIVDLWPPGTGEPLRLDFFGSTLDAIRGFDADTQLLARPDRRDRTVARERSPARRRLHQPLPHRLCRHFRAGQSDDPLYEAVSAGRKHQGMEHWLPLFHERLETLFDYLPGALIVLSHQTEDAKSARLELIADYYETRKQFLRSAAEGARVAPYKPLPPEALYLTPRNGRLNWRRHRVRDLSPFQAPESKTSVDAGGRLGRDFAPERAAWQRQRLRGRGGLSEGAAGRRASA